VGFEGVTTPKTVATLPQALMAHGQVLMAPATAPGV